MKNALLHVSVLTAIIGIAAGCATKGDLDEVRATAETALSEARAARDAAGAGGQDALSAAQDAKSAAQAAQACCNENTTRLDRMFEKAMRK